MSEQPAAKAKKRPFSTILILLTVFAGLISAGAVYFVVSLDQFGDKPCDTDAETIVVRIQPGQTIQKTANQLYVLNVISDPLRFRLLARFKDLGHRIKVGEYRLSAAMSPNQILNILVTGKSILYRVTIPEGFNLKQVSQAVEKAGLCKAKDFYQAATDHELARNMGLAANTFEGYLFPDTYFFPRETKPQAIITAMLKRFANVFTDAWKKRADEIGFSVHQVVTLASIIEKETGAAAERPLISSVFHNRLRKRMRLESDPTVIYGIRDYRGNITRRHLKTYTPYNTYRIRGLPPGPIANPGKASLKAALFPAKTRYLFFVSKKDRTHHFSRTMAEHNRAVRKYQLRRR